VRLAKPSPLTIDALHMLTSFETYLELQEAGLSDRQVTTFIQEAAARELL